MRKSYATDLSDSEWAFLRDRLPELPKRVKTRAHSLRDIFDAIFYVLKTGCHWRLLPHDFPPWQTVFYHFRRFRLSGMWHRIFTILRTAERKRAGKDPDASAAIMDSQSIKTTEECRKPDSGGYDAHKNVKGRKRHLLVDTLGWIALDLRQPRRRSGPGRCAPATGRVKAAGAAAEEDMGGRSLQR